MGERELRAQSLEASPATPFSPASAFRIGLRMPRQTVAIRSGVGRGAWRGVGRCLRRGLDAPVSGAKREGAARAVSGRPATPHQLTPPPLPLHAQARAVEAQVTLAKKIAPVHLGALATRLVGGKAAATAGAAAAGHELSPTTPQQASFAATATLEAPPTTTAPHAAFPPTQAGGAITLPRPAPGPRVTSPADPPSSEGDLAARRARRGLAPGALDPATLPAPLAARAKELAGRQAYLKNFWYAAALSEAVPADKPVGVELLGEKLTLFRDSAGTVRALHDVCPHRGAPLHQGWVGKVEGHDCVVCPYHGKGRATGREGGRERGGGWWGMDWTKKTTTPSLIFPIHNFIPQAGPLTGPAPYAPSPPPSMRASGRTSAWSTPTPSSSAAASSGCSTGARTSPTPSGRPSRPCRSWRTPAGRPCTGRSSSSATTGACLRMRSTWRT